MPFDRHHAACSRDQMATRRRSHHSRRRQFESPRRWIPLRVTLVVMGLRTLSRPYAADAFPWWRVVRIRRGFVWSRSRDRAAFVDAPPCTDCDCIEARAPHAPQAQASRIACGRRRTLLHGPGELPTKHWRCNRRLSEWWLVLPARKWRDLPSRSPYLFVSVASRPFVG